MKELISEQQADLIVLLLSIAVTLGSLVFAYLKNPSTPKDKKRLLWANTGLVALVGPVIWVFWACVYNPIENHYGLDSLKALKINFLIAIVLGAGFTVLASFVPKWVSNKPAPSRKK